MTELKILCNSSDTPASLWHSIKQIESFPREGEPLIAPGRALAEPGVTYNKNRAPVGAQESFTINQKQTVDQME